MRQYQIHKSGTDYAISDFGKSKINFATNKDFGLKYKKKDVFETETATKPAFINHIRTYIISHGVHSIYNSKGEACEQIVNMPDKVLASKEILIYLNKYTILPQETPPWQEIIYKLKCYSDILTGEYIDRIGVSFSYLKEGLDRSEEDIDEHYFVSSPKITEKKRGSVFHLPKPNRAHRKWIILNEYYDFKKNAWVDKDSGKVENRKGDRIEIVTNEKPIDKNSVSAAIEDFLKQGGKIKNLNEKKREPVFDWKETKIHKLAHLIPVMGESDRGRLKEDIRLNGVKESLWLYEGKIIEGRTRFGICLELGIKPDFKAFKGPGSPRAFVISMNVHRRHLSSSQIAAIGVDQYLEKFEKEAKERLKTNMNGANSKNSNMNIMHVKKVLQADKGRVCMLLADKLKTNQQYILDAKRIKENSPELFQKIISGELTISKAKSQLSPKKKQKTYKFEKEYKRLLKILVDKNYQAAVVNLSKLFLRWNKRNDKKLVTELKEFEGEHIAILKQKPKLELVINKSDDSEQLLEM